MQEDANTMKHLVITPEWIRIIVIGILALQDLVALGIEFQLVTSWPIIMSVIGQSLGSGPLR